MRRACPTGCARPGHRAAGPGPRRPWSLPQERNSPGRLSHRQGLCQGERPLRGEPLRRLRASLRERALRATSPFRGGRPKSRLRRLAVGLLRSPLEGRFAAGFVAKGTSPAVCKCTAGGERPCGGTPPSSAGDTSPFRGGRPKSRLRRLAVGAASQPFGGTIYGIVCAKECWPCRPIRPSGRGF